MCAAWLVWAVASAALALATSDDLETSCDVSKCNIRLLQYYKELGCEPIPTANSCCPHTFDCDVLSNRSTDQCYYRGRVFQPGEHISHGASPNPCIVDCVCRREADGPALFSCVSSECPDVFGPPLPPGCVRLYRLDQCCDVGTYCDDSGQPAPFQCEHQGKTYLEGQYIYSEGYHCKSCICQRGFNGTLDGPWCHELSCDMELHHSHWLQQGCAPVFYGEEVCCPIDWRCPVDTDTVVFPGSEVVVAPTAAAITDASATATASLADAATDATNATSSAETATGGNASASATWEAPAASEGPASDGQQCVFGHLRLPVGARLSPGDNPCVECTCHTPPHVACQQTPHALCSRHAASAALAVPAAPATPPPG